MLVIVVDRIDFIRSEVLKKSLEISDDVAPSVRGGYAVEVPVIVDSAEAPVPKSGTKAGAVGKHLGIGGASIHIVENAAAITEQDDILLAQPEYLRRRHRLPLTHVPRTAGVAVGYQNHLNCIAAGQRGPGDSRADQCFVIRMRAD